MAFTQIQICNMALTYTGQSPITSMSDGSAQAVTCSMMWDICRQAVLRDCNWNFATKIIPLALLSNESIPGWNNCYGFPSDCLYIQDVFAQTFDVYASPVYPSWPQEPYPLNPFPPISAAQDWLVVQSADLQQKIIVSNIDNAYIRYIADIVDTMQFDAEFVECLSWALAAKIAQAITGNKDLTVYCQQMYAVVLDKARITNLFERRKANLNDSSYILSR